MWSHCGYRRRRPVHLSQHCGGRIGPSSCESNVGGTGVDRPDSQCREHHGRVNPSVRRSGGSAIRVMLQNESIVLSDFPELRLLCDSPTTRHLQHLAPIPVFGPHFSDTGPENPLDILLRNTTILGGCFTSLCDLNPTSKTSLGCFAF